MTADTPPPKGQATPRDTPGLAAVNPEKRESDGTQDPTTKKDTEGPWVFLREAAQVAGVTVSALRKRYRAGDLERRYDNDGRVLLDLGAVRDLYRIPVEEDRPSPETVTETLEASDGVLVPHSAWEKMLDQLGNLHEAGQNLAEARERAARAEERERFAQERRREAEERVAEVEAKLAGLAPDTATPTPTSESRWQRVRGFVRRR